MYQPMNSARTGPVPNRCIQATTPTAGHTQSQLVFSWVSFQWFQIVFWKFLKDFLILRSDIMYFVMPPTSQFGFVIVGSVRFSN